MLYEEKDIPEIHFMKHRHDNNKEFVDYEKNILSNKLSPYIYKNDLMNSFLTMLQPLVAKLFDQMNVIKNFQNYMVDKYYYKHPK
jgi:hypothetical protein